MSRTTSSKINLSRILEVDLMNIKFLYKTKYYNYNLFFDHKNSIFKYKTTMCIYIIIKTFNKNKYD